jgi:hypothetical protein
MKTSNIVSGKQLRAQKHYMQLTRNSTRNSPGVLFLNSLILKEIRNGLIAQFACNFARNFGCNSRIKISSIPLAYQGLKKKGIIHLFACKAKVNKSQTEAEELDAVIRQNLEVLGYGE